MALRPALCWRSWWVATSTFFDEEARELVELLQGGSRQRLPELVQVVIE